MYKYYSYSNKISSPACPVKIAYFNLSFHEIDLILDKLKITPLLHTPSTFFYGRKESIPAKLRNKSNVLKGNERGNK